MPMPELYGEIKQRKMQYKDFRKSSYFKPVAQNITADVKNFMKHCSQSRQWI